MDITVKDKKLNLNYKDKDYRLIDNKIKEIKMLYFLREDFKVKADKIPSCLEVMTWENNYYAVVIKKMNRKERKYERGDVIEEKIEVDKEAKGLISMLK
jgi:hypothetical protein